MIAHAPVFIIFDFQVSFLISISAALILYLIIGLNGRSKDNNTNNSTQDTTPPQTQVTAMQSESETETTAESAISSDNQIELIAGELGEYGQTIVLGENTEFPDTNYCYFVPDGVYQVTNVGEYRTQVDVNKNEIATETDADGNSYEVWADGTPYLIDVDETIEITVSDGYFIEIEEPTHLILVPAT